MTSSYVPSPPKGTGMSRRLGIALGVMVLLVSALFLGFLYRYASRRAIPFAAPTAVKADAGTSEQMIEAIEHEPTTPRIVKPLASSSHPHPTPSKILSAYPLAGGDPSGNPALASDPLQAGRESDIQVYHKNWPMTGSNQVSSDDPIANPTSQPAVNEKASVDEKNEKIAFLHQANHPSESDVIPSELQHPLSRDTLQAGTIIPATLVTGIHSDLPGEIIARVRRDVFDSVSGNDCLIPQGTTLIGVYDSQIAYGQERVLIVWSRLLLPNGDSYDLQGQPGADLAGMAGLQDRVNHHYFRLFSSALLFSLFGAAGQMSQPQRRHAADSLSAQEMLYGAIGEQMNQTGAQLIAKNMDIQPTIRIRPGTNFNVLLTRDMVLPSAYRF